MRQSDTSKAANESKFAYGDAKALYFMYLMCFATDEVRYCNYVNEYMRAHLRKAGEEINGYYREKRIDLFWCSSLAGMGAALLTAGKHEWKEDIYVILCKIASIMTDSMWKKPNCQCYENAGSVEFLMDMFDVTRDGTFLHQAKTVAKYIYTQRFYNAQKDVQFTGGTKRSSSYDYGAGAAGAMRAILRADGYVHGRQYILGDLRNLKL